MKTLRFLPGLALLLMLSLGAAAHPLEYKSYESGGVFPEIYRDDFAQTLKKYPNGRFAKACKGDRVAMQKYFNRALDTTLDGKRTDALGYVLVKIMFRVGDEKFAKALRGGERAVREAVGRNIDPIIARNKLSFPKTRACYRFRAVDEG